MVVLNSIYYPLILKLHTNTSLYLYLSLYIELWWVLRTPSKYVVQKRKGFSVSTPPCTFDAANNRYFPYAIVNDDGTIQE